jgi:zinc protease
VAGDVDPDTGAQRLSALLADLEGGEFTPPSPADEEPLTEVRTAELVKDREQAHVVMGFRGVSVHDEDRYALEVIAQLLAGQGGRLFLELRDRRGLAYAVNAMSVEGVAPGFFAVYIATAPEKLEHAKAGLLEQLQGLLEGPPNELELEQARRHLIGNHAIDQQRNAAHAAQVSLNALYGLGPDAELAFAERVQAVSKDDVLRVATRIIDLDAYALAVVRP